MSLILRVGGIRVGGALISVALTSAALISGTFISGTFISGTFISAFPIPGIFFHRPESLCHVVPSPGQYPGRLLESIFKGTTCGAAGPGILVVEPGGKSLFPGLLHTNPDSVPPLILQIRSLKVGPGVHKAPVHAFFHHLANLPGQAFLFQFPV